MVFSKGPIHLADCLVKMPSGKILSRQILEHDGAVVIIPRLKNHKYLLIRQFRLPAKGWIWEFPAGGIEKGETARQAAKRELIEEVCFKPRKLTKMLHFYPTPGVSQEVMYLYLAEDLMPEEGVKDEDEEIEVHCFSLAEIGRMIRSGKILDAKTIIAYYWLKENR